ncbi:hypothetical protein ACGF5O_37065 [Streptomyces sp. NPDC048291]
MRDRGLEPAAAPGRIRQPVLSAVTDDIQPPGPGTADPLARIG